MSYSIISNKGEILENGLSLYEAHNSSYLENSSNFIQECGMKTYKIFDVHNIGHRGIYIDSDENPIEFAVYCQLFMEFMVENCVSVSNLGIASALVAFFGCEHGATCESAIPIEMYSERENHFGEWFIENVQSGDESKFFRKGLYDYLLLHITDD